MRALHPDLLAAQQDPSAVPYVQVQVSDRVAQVTNTRWQRLYQGSEAEAPHAACLDSGGTLHRLRVDPATPSLQYARVPNPDALSDYSQWTQVTTNVAQTGVAIAAAGQAVMRAFAIAGGTEIATEQSTDGGATWPGTFPRAVTGATSLGWMALVVEDANTAIIVYEDNGVVKAVRKTGGSWGSPSPWSETVGSITGIAMTKYGDFNIAIAGTDAAGHAKVWTIVCGDGFDQAADTWSPLRELAHAEGGSGVTFRAPGITVLDTHRLFFVEAYAGTAAYSRPQWTWSPPAQQFAANAWRELVPFDLESAFGVAVTGDGSYAWLTTPDGVWRASLLSPATDLSEAVQEIASETRRTGAAVRVILRNDDGRFNNLAAGPYAAIRAGAQIDLSPGYVTSSGQRVSTGLRYWIDGWEHVTRGGAATLVLHASDAWGPIERWRARRQYTWQAGATSVSQIMRFVLGRAGIELLNVGISQTATLLEPDFTINPGEDGLRTVRRLLAMIPDVLRVSGEFAVLSERGTGDATDYGYGAGHPILSGRYRDGGLAANRAQVFGEGVVAEAFDWQDIEDQLDRLRQVRDRNMTTEALAQARSEAELRREELALANGELLVTTNCGQELYDVIEVTDAQAGLGAQRFRVAGIDFTYRRRGRPAYEQRLLLGRV